MNVRCSRCLYDESTPNITFDSGGVCNYCHTHDRLELEYPTGSEGERRLAEIADEVRVAGRGKKYDCVVGVSGGCDSSFMLYKTKELGLRPLAVHFDNTWDSTVAVENIHRVLKALDVDLYTHVVDNKEYDSIYRAFMLAGVPDIEAPTDIGLAATLNIAAEKHGVKYVFEGHNFRSEGISPLGWLYMDGKYIQSVVKAFGTRPLKTFPNMSMGPFLRWMIVRGIRKIRPLYYVDYQKEQVKEFLSRDFGWQWYGGHHLENRFTAFYHSYFIPERFGMDFRLLGYSALIRSGQMSREEGLALLEEPFHLESDIVALVKKRLGFSDDEFEQLMEAPRRTYRDYTTYKRTFERMRPFFWLMYKLDRVPQSFYMKFTVPDRLASRTVEAEIPKTIHVELEPAPGEPAPTGGTVHGE